MSTEEVPAWASTLRRKTKHRVNHQLKMPIDALAFDELVVSKVSGFVFVCQLFNTLTVCIGLLGGMCRGKRHESRAM